MKRARWTMIAMAMLAACGGGDERNCTAVGCLNGLTITLTTPPAGAYRVEALGPGETTPHAQDCPGTNACVIVFSNYQPATVTISVISAAGTTTYNKTPAYTTSFPNGPECGPACSNGAVTVP